MMNVRVHVLSELNFIKKALQWLTMVSNPSKLYDGQREKDFNMKSFLFPFLFCSMTNHSDVSPIWSNTVKVEKK